MKPTCKILISYHKKDFLIKDDILTPIHAGRAIALKQPGSSSLEWLLSNMEGDNTGDNISEKNGSYNELTTIYWAWKNYQDLGNPQWIGFMHYRRHFLFKGGPRSCYENEGIYPEYLDEIGYSPARLEEILSDADFVTVKPQYRVSMYEHYQRNHRIEDLDRAIRILKEKYPEYSAAADQYLAGEEAYFCNMFIFPKDAFFRYASWIFDILFQFEQEVDLSEKRLFISEWLTGIFIQKLISERKKGVFLPTIYAESERIIPVVMALDENYLLPTSTAIASLLTNAKKQTKYDIYLLVPNELSACNRDLLRSYQDKYPGCKINFISMENEFEDATISLSHITKVTYYRLMIPSLLPQYSKCIYLDGDLVVDTDLTDMYRTNVDDFYVAGVKAAGYMYPEWKIEYETQRTGLPSISQYINAGVLIMNLAKMRKHNLQDQFLELAKLPFQSQDQDVINIACYNSIKILPPKFNLMTKYLTQEKGRCRFNDIGQNVYAAEECAEALSNPVIIHFADKRKPWNERNSILSLYWWKYYKYSPYYLPAYDALANGSNGSTEIQLRNARKELQSIKASWSFRIGRAITFLPRKVRGFISCILDHGLGYTMCYSVKKVFSLVKKCGTRLILLPKKVRGFFRCIKQHGLLYTVKYSFKKILRTR